MEDFIPTIPEVIKNYILTLSAMALPYLYSKFIRGINVHRLPAWAIQALAIYTVASLIIISYNYYRQHKPLVVHMHQRFDHQTIELDGNSYQYCVFSNVKFKIKGNRRFNLYANQYEPNTCEIVLEDRAAIGFNLIQDMRSDKYFNPIANEFLKNMMLNKDFTVPDDHPEQTIDDL